jgi:hypothetical protein
LVAGIKNTFQDQTLLVPELKKENLQTKDQNCLGYFLFNENIFRIFISV